MFCGLQNLINGSHTFKHCFETRFWNAQKGAIQNRVSLETRILKSYKHNSDLKHGLNDVTVAWQAKGQAAQNEMRNGTVRESQKHAREKTLIYKRSSVKPGFKTVFQNAWFSLRKIL